MCCVIYELSLVAGRARGGQMMPQQQMLRHHGSHQQIGGRQDAQRQQSYLAASLDGSVQSQPEARARFLCEFLLSTRIVVSFSTRRSARF